jgi:hypothetical protein
MAISDSISYRYCNGNTQKKVAEVSLPTRHEIFMPVTGPENAMRTWACGP